jgi:hypothetical protein
MTTATRKKANTVQWKIWAAGTRWAKAGEAGLLFFSSFFFDCFSPLFILLNSFGDKNGGKEDLENIQNSLETFLELDIYLKTISKVYT